MEICHPRLFAFDKMGVDFRSLIEHSRLSSMWEKSWIEKKRGAEETRFPRGLTKSLN